MILGEGEGTGVAAGVGVGWNAAPWFTHSPVSSPAEKSIVKTNRRVKFILNFIKIPKL